MSFEQSYPHQILLKDTLKVFDDFKNKQQKCMK